MKWLIRIIMLLLILLVLGAVGLYLSLNHIVKSVVESQGTEQLKVPTTLGAVNLGLSSVSLDTLAIGSPEGFTAPQMFSVGKLAVDTGGIMRLRDKPIHLTSITIDAPVLVVEQHGSKLNFKALMDNLPSSPDKGQTPAPASGESEPTKLVIDTLSITNAHVMLDSDIPGLTKGLDVPIPAISMKNIGNADGADNGAAIKDVVTTVIAKMVDEATHSSGLPIDVKGLLSGNLSGVQDKLSESAQKQLDQLKVPVNIGGLLNQFTGNKQKQ